LQSESLHKQFWINFGKMMDKKLQTGYSTLKVASTLRHNAPPFRVRSF